MATLTEIKEELQFNVELIDLLDVMKNIAVFQFRALKGKKERFARFLMLLKDFYRRVDLSLAPSLLTNPKAEKLAIVAVTSDEGFMGGLNLQVIEAAFKQPGAEDAEFIVVGERGAMYLRELDRKFTLFTGNTDAEERYKLALRLKDFIIMGIKSERFGKVIISYPNPVSFMVQRVDIVKILPVSSILDEREKVEYAEPIIMESSLEAVIEYLVEQSILQKLLGILEDGKLSEFAARAIHLEKGGQDLSENEKKIRFKYFRAYHMLIDKNIRELFSAQVMRGKG